MKRRVALITHDLSPVGGLPTMISFLYRTLERSGRYRPELILLATSISDQASVRLRAPHTWLAGVRLRQVKWHDLEYLHVGAWGSELEFQRYQPRRKLSRLLGQYDLLQFVVGSPPWVCAAANVGRPTLLWTATTTRADRESQLRPGSLPWRVWSSLMIQIAERYEQRGLRSADAIFALSDYTLECVRPLIEGRPAVLATCGVDTHLFRPAGTSKRDYILSVARFSDPRKNVELLLNAYALLCQRITSAPDLYLVGDPPTQPGKDLIERLGIQEKVKILGPKRGEELAELYRTAKFFALSSNEEGLAIVILEAMASGLPVVSTDCGGPSTAVKEGETGFLTPVGDAPVMAAAMERLLNDAALCERMSVAGRRAAEERFSLEAAGRVFLDKYDELLGVETARRNGNG